MKIKLSIAILFLVAPMSTAIFAQDPKALQIDEFGRIYCDELGSRASNLVQQISNTPGSRALVIYYPKPNWRKMVTGQFRQILAQFEFAEMDDRVDFVIGDERNEVKVEFWKMPSGAADPRYKGERWVLPKPDLSKAFIYDSVDENGECSTFVVRKFAELLSNNPGSRAYIVVRSGGLYAFPAHGFADEWVNDLRKKFRISRKRIRVFCGKPTTRSLTYAEFWFVPAKRK